MFCKKAQMQRKKRSSKRCSSTSSNVDTHHGDVKRVRTAKEDYEKERKQTERVADQRSLAGERVRERVENMPQKGDEGEQEKEMEVEKRKRDLRERMKKTRHVSEQVGERKDEREHNVEKTERRKRERRGHSEMKEIDGHERVESGKEEEKGENKRETTEQKERRTRYRDSEQSIQREEQRKQSEEKEKDRGKKKESAKEETERGSCERRKSRKREHLNEEDSGDTETQREKAKQQKKGEGKGERKKEAGERDTRGRLSRQGERDPGGDERKEEDEESEEEERKRGRAQQKGGGMQRRSERLSKKHREKELAKAVEEEEEKVPVMRGGRATSGLGRPSKAIQDLPICEYPARKCLCEDLYAKFHWKKGENEKQRQIKAARLLSYLDRYLFGERARFSFRNHSYRNAVRLNNTKEWGATYERISKLQITEEDSDGKLIVLKEYNYHNLRMVINLGKRFEHKHFPSDLCTFHVYLLTLLHELCHVITARYHTSGQLYGFKEKKDGTDRILHDRIHSTLWRQLCNRASQAITNSKVCSLYKPWMIGTYGSKPYTKSGQITTCNK